MAHFLLSTWEEPRKWRKYRKNCQRGNDNRLKNGQGEWTRITDLFVPNEARWPLRYTLDIPDPPCLIGLYNGPGSTPKPLFSTKQLNRFESTEIPGELVAGRLDSTPTPYTLLLLPSGVRVSGVESWVRKLAGPRGYPKCSNIMEVDLTDVILWD